VAGDDVDAQTAAQAAAFGLNDPEPLGGERYAIESYIVHGSPSRTQLARLSGSLKRLAELANARLTLDQARARVEAPSRG
tara:strand:- start:22022 stop:22261 length:240 start_codon:yes stop_codon:yes gene_type:complete